MNGGKTGPVRSDLYDLLALMTMGACFWFIGGALGLFNALTRFAAEHGLLNFIMLIACTSLGAIAAMARKSMQLRSAITARMEAEKAAERNARHDSLTGLANRRFFNEALIMALAARPPGESFAVMLIDLDRFKPVNDVHGHAAGNAVLCAVADRLLRTAPFGSTIARLGGDEFVALLPGMSNPDALTSFAGRLIESVRKPIAWNQGHVEIDATIGIALASPELTDPEALLHAADVAMYEGKRSGRGVAKFFHAGMDEALRARGQLEADLRHAISSEQILPHYQPIVTLPKRDLVGFEVLARWNHPVRGDVSPDSFIPIAEECGMISELFYHVLRSACFDARSWPNHLRLAVNVSPTQLQDRRLPERILGILTRTGFPANRLEVEVTETALISDIEAARICLTSLQNLGVRIALDDFGTGYSTLYHLSELRFNKLKIDRSYVTSLDQGSERAKLVDAILQLGSTLSVETTAEGIETETNIAWLTKAGCTFGQGFLFGHAMSKADADTFIGKLDAQGAPLVLAETELKPDSKVDLIRAARR